jgi:uncharacterized protein YjiS (DUF1127 family)
MTLMDTFFRPLTLHRNATGPKLSAFNRLYDVWRQRQALRKLDFDALNDIGISRRDAFAEARRPFWDAPSTWRK